MTEIMRLWWMWLIGTLVFGGWAVLGATAVFLNILSRRGHGGHRIRVPGAYLALFPAALCAILLVVSGITALVT